MKFSQRIKNQFAKLMGKKTIRISFGDNKRSITDANGRVWVFTVCDDGNDTIRAEIAGVQPTEEEAKPFLVAVKLWIIQGCAVARPDVYIKIGGQHGAE